MKRLNAQQTRLALDSGLVDNADSETPGCVDLPDGHPHAERVSIRRNRRTGKTSMSLGCPWLLADIFNR